MLGDYYLIMFFLYFALPNLIIFTIPGIRWPVKILLFFGILLACMVTIYAVY